MDLEALVRAFECFRDLSAEERAAMAEQLKRVSVRSGDVVFHQGDHEVCAYLLTAGEVDIRLALEDHDDRTLATVRSGAILGEIALLTGGPRSATAVARTSAELYRVDRDPFERALRQGDAWAVQLVLLAARILGRRLRALDAELAVVIESGPTVPCPELEKLRSHLFTEWSF